jgi:hypothetical protein
MTKVVSLKPRTRGARRSAAEWRDLISTFKRSGETRRAFCTRHGIALSTFAWWQGRERTRISTTPSAAPAFVELVPEVPTTTATKYGTALDLELELGDGLVIRLRRPLC